MGAKVEVMMMVILKLRGKQLKKYSETKKKPVGFFFYDFSRFAFFASRRSFQISIKLPPNQ